MEVGSALFALPKREVHVWKTDFERPTSSVLDLLEPQERERAARFKVEAPRRQFIISHAFLRLVLARYLGIAPPDVRFRVAAHGKPELEAATDLRFNLSHTEGAALLAVARDRRVGVDVERVRENLHPLELADRFFSSSEAAWLRSQPRSEQIPSFFACWTAKEAYIKAHGNGFFLPLSGFTVIPQGANQPFQPEIHDKAEQPGEWTVWQLDLGPNLRGTLAAEGRGFTLNLRDWPWP
jgi:4'-phosphopantetheinyl transferase